MTIIAYRSGQMVSDGMISEDDTIVTNKGQKIHKLKSGALFGLAGDADVRELVVLFDKVKGTNFPPNKKIASLGLAFKGILVLPDLSIWNVDCEKDEETKEWGASIIQINEPFYAVGVGSPWAIGAMDRGATALQAVKTAIKYCAVCGGKPQIYTISKEESQS